MHAIGQISTRSARSLLDRALAVLSRNASGNWTRPAPHTGPHQRSWSTAFTAIGHAHVDPTRGARELLHLFNGQWANGLLPHMVFTHDPDTDYFPGPDVWRTECADAAPISMMTSAIVHPPFHATAALRVADALGDDGTDFLGLLYPRLAAWHDYLLSSRIRNDVPLVEVWHPWETGMDNSPMWDEPLDAVPPTGTSYSRTDLRHGQTGERPSDWFYDRAMSLIEDMRGLDYMPDRVRTATRFAVHDVLFNSLLVRAELDIGEIAQRVGGAGSRHTLRSRRIATLLNRELFDRHDAWYVDRDVLTGRRLPLASAAQLSPMYAGVPDPSRAALLVDMWRAMSAADASPLPAMMGTADPGQKEFSASNGSRGPAWFNLNWLVHEGLRAYGYNGDATRLRKSMLHAVDRVGFWEHYDLATGEGHGAPNFSWTAALTLDLLATEHLEPHAA